MRPITSRQILATLTGMRNKILSLVTLALIPFLTTCNKCLEVEVRSNDYFKSTIKGELPDGTKIDTSLILTSTLAGLDRIFLLKDGLSTLYTFQISSSSYFTDNNLYCAQMQINQTSDNYNVIYMSVYFPIGSATNLCLNKFEQLELIEFRYDTNDYCISGRVNTIMYSIIDKNYTNPFEVEAEFHIKMWDEIDY
jgi:hypothetical protein